MTAPMPAARVEADGLLSRCCWEAYLAGCTAGHADGYLAGYAAAEGDLAAIQRRAHEVVSGLSRDPVRSVVR